MLTACLAFIATACIACGRNKNEPTPSDEQELQTAVNEIIERRAGMESSREDIPAKPDDASDSEAIEDWPEDVPLIEPYKVQTYVAGAQGFKQISFESPHTLEEVFDFYNKQLFEVHGWALAGNEMGQPDVFFKYKVGKDGREVELAVRADSDGKRCLIMMKVYD